MMIVLYLIGALAGFLNRKLSYFLGLLASLLALYVGVKATFFGFAGTALFHFFDNTTVGITIDKLNGMFLAIASLSFIAVTLFSLDFGELYRKRMAIFLNLSMLGMVLILLAHDGITFLIGWEIMTIFSYLLIVEHKGAYKEAFKFLAFSELSTVLLIVGFLALYISKGSFELSGKTNNLVFVLFTSLAFIIKMGIVPFHTWLKDAHSKAPSNASALLSAPVTLMGVYGLFRVIDLAGYNHLWGIIAVILGSVSAFWGAISAAASKGLKILPAYSTVENNGMILAMLGFAACAHAYSTNSTLFKFAYLTAIVLSLSHTLAKTLLFLSIGQAKEQLGEESIDNVRGIHESVGKIPALGVVISGLSFSAFPLLLGYVAEWMMLESIFQSYQFASVFDRVITSTGGVLLSLGMGFASFSMIKLIGYSALGFSHGKKAKPMNRAFMHSAELLLMGLIVLFSLFAVRLFLGLGYSQFVIGALAVPTGWLIASAKPVFGVISPTFLAIVLSVLFIVPLLIYLKSRATSKRVISWNGGLELKEEEYFTANAFSFIIEYILRFVYATKEIREGNQAYVLIKDVFDDFYTYFVGAIGKFSYFVSELIMNGRVYLYLSYILAMFILIFIVFG